jgi:large subunit ribosomal protein L21
VPAGFVPWTVPISTAPPGVRHRAPTAGGAPELMRVEESEPVSTMVYAIVRAGGRQEKVAVGDVLEIDRVQGDPGSTLELPVLLLVDGETVTSDRSALAKATVTAEVVAATKGPKIDIMKFKNKTGYRRRQGHRQRHTKVKVTSIETGSTK